MSSRLEITLFGTFYRIGILRLGHEAVKAGMKTYGPKKWHAKVVEIALGMKGNRLTQNISHTIGHPIHEIYHAQGIALHGRTFGMEVFHKGNFAPVDMVEASNRELHPKDLMKDCKRHDVLGVFWAKRDDALFFRWEDVDQLNQEDIVLTYDSLAPILGRKRAFDIVLDVTWQGQAGQRKKMGAKTAFTPMKHVFHVKK